MEADARFLVLHPGDNIGVAAVELAPTCVLQHGAATVALKQGIDIGHKFALRAIAQGERIMKYSAPIGRATRAIEAGEYVHTHNMASDYLPTYTLTEGKTYLGSKP